MHQHNIDTLLNEIDHLFDERLVAAAICFQV